jgi:multidrug efflux pump subunit AcrA (membrane-fusion protein)
MRTATFVALSFAVALSACSRSDQPAGKAVSGPTRDVRVASVRTRPMERVLPVAGTLAANEQAVLSVKVPGRVARFAVDIGSVVRHDQVVAEIERTDYELRLQQVAAALARTRAAVGLPLEGDDDRFDPEATSVVRETRALLEEATQNRERVRNLSKAGVSSQSELDAVEAAYNVALSRHESAREEVRRRQAELAERRAEYQIARQQLADTAIRAPFDGAVQLRQANLGEFLSVGAPVATVLRTDPLRLRLEVPERESIGLKVGQAVRVRTEGGDRVHTGRLARLSPGVTETSRVLLVEADIPNDGSLRPGLFARAEIVLRADEPGLTVPQSSLITFAGIEKVVLAVDGRAKETPVRTGRRGAHWVEVAGGIKAGDLVVMEPGNLRTGEALNVTVSEAGEPADARSGY